MGNDTYSVQTLVVENGKNVKGTLTLSIDKYEFNGAQKTINWENASTIRGTSTVKSFIFKSEKPHVVICEGDNYGPAFILDAAQADELDAKISEFGVKARERRIEEEERRRREEEERKRSEEERKRREEEERRRREEEERKRREEERRRKEDEERKAREALAKKIEARTNRLSLEVDAAKDAAQSVTVSQGVESSIKKAWAYITENPYRILGVPVTATNDEAHASLDKIKKLTRLNAVASFKSSFEINGLEKPARDLSIVQNALSVLKDQRYKWFWFSTQDACVAWQSESFRKELTYDGIEFGTYDLFLANYAYALFFDPTFKKSSLWKPVFRYYIYICNDSSQVQIKSRFNEKELSELRVLDAVRNFKAEIFKPVETLCDTEDAKMIIRLCKILKEIGDDNLNDLKKSVLTKLTKWFTSKESVVCGLVNDADEDHVITPSEAKEIKKAGDVYIRAVDKVLEDALSVLQNETVRYEMIKESYRHATWQLMFGLHKAEDKDAAIIYANKCYPYCKEDDKRKIRNTFGFSAIKGADRDATHSEWDLMGDNYYEGKNGYEQDYDEAFKWYTKAANAGNKYSQNSLGICYKEGHGTYQSDYQAAEWFEKAYKNGNADGAFNLAQCYESGDGRVKDKMKAVDLYLEAAKLGHPTAADVGKALLELMQLEQKIHRLSQHEHYDLGFQSTYGHTVVVEVTLNYSANVYLMSSEDYAKYRECDNFSYYGGRATQSPYRIKIPHSGSWHLVIDNGDEDMTGIITSVGTRTFNF